jgi:hypothetical protein
MTNNAVEANISNSSSVYTHDADPDWIQAAYNNGVQGATMSRVECIAVSRSSGIKMPRWLMKCPSRRLGRGLYALPELAVYSSNQRAKGEA